MACAIRTVPGPPKNVIVYSPGGKTLSKEPAQIPPRGPRGMPVYEDGWIHGDVSYVDVKDPTSRPPSPRTAKVSFAGASLLLAAISVPPGATMTNWGRVDT